MILDNKNAQTIAAHFGNKFNKIVYCGCWNKSTVTFAVYQDNTEAAGFELTIERPEGDYLETVKVKQVRRLHSYAYNEQRQRYERKPLPIYKA